jgi:GTP cyclohydrolase I
MAGVSELKPVIGVYIDDQYIMFLPTVSVLVSTSNRGIHMSRLVESLILGFFETEKSQKLEDLGKNLIKYIIMRKKTIGTEIDPVIEVVCKGEYVYEILEHCTITLKTTYEHGKITNVVAVTVRCISACPCALDTSNHKLTHTQNVDVTISKENGKAKELLKIIEKVVPKTRTILKRDEEVATIQTAYDNPMFVEDIVRKLSEYDVRVSVISHESIHKHKAIAKTKEIQK